MLEHRAKVFGTFLRGVGVWGLEVYLTYTPSPKPLLNPDPSSL